MIARRKVVPPVTPRIVQEHPRHRLLRYGLLIGAVLLTVWFSYDYGRTQAPASAEAPVAQSSGEAAQRVAELEQERDALHEQVAALEKRVQQLGQALDAARTSRRVSEPAPPAPREVREAEPAPVEQQVAPVARKEEPADNRLKLENLQLSSTAADKTYRIAFSLMHVGNSSGRVIGTVWIAVNGFMDGKPTRLSLKTLSPERHPYVKIGFDVQQDVSEELVLPAGFRPKNVLIEAKPFGEKYVGASETLPWDAD